MWDTFSRPRDEGAVIRVRAAAAAGCRAIGLSISSWAWLRDRPDELAAVDAALDETGIVVADIETLRGWAVPDDPVASETLRRHEALAFEMADHWDAATCR